MLSEAILKITPEERKLVANYLHDFNEILPVIFQEGPQDPDDLVEKCNDFAMAYDGKIANNLSFRFSYNPATKNRGEYYGEDTIAIYINLYHWVKVKRFGTNNLRVVSVETDRMMIMLMHEFMHYKQDMEARSQSNHTLVATSHKNLKSYFQDPRERQSFAIGHLEQLKKLLKTEDPKKMLGHLRSMGLIDNAVLNDLKNSDLRSWKAIMKNAVVTVLRDLKAKKSKTSPALP